MIVEKKSLENGRDMKLIEQVKKETDDRFQRTRKMCISVESLIQQTSNLEIEILRDETYICIINR